ESFRPHTKAGQHMSRHPLESEDYSLVQDYLLTKAILLAAARVDNAFWEHEIQSLRADAGDAWGHHVAFLLDVTLARIASVSLRYAGQTPEDPWTREFVAAIEDQDYVVASESWASANRAASVRDGGELETTRSLRALF